jgi:hypothetical protein
VDKKYHFPVRERGMVAGLLKDKNGKEVDMFLTRRKASSES